MVGQSATGTPCDAVGFFACGVRVVHVCNLVSTSIAAIRPIPPNSSPGYLPTPHSFTTSISGATVVMTITGFCWAITQWVPFALVRTLPLFPLLSSICLPTVIDLYTSLLRPSSPTPLPLRQGQIRPMNALETSRG